MVAPAGRAVMVLVTRIVSTPVLPETVEVTTVGTGVTVMVVVVPLDCLTLTTCCFLACFLMTWLTASVIFAAVSVRVEDRSVRLSIVIKNCKSTHRQE